jgi:7,8-dihydropterin-6-yl-methyl-4-(beta-D-ribofuranosyl)aminobenzene 5'-phosphate synthase
MAGLVTLKPVDAVEVTVLVDNVHDALVADSGVATRPKRRWDTFDREPLRAEHGYSLLVTVESGSRRESILYDAGVGRDTVLHNLDVLEIPPLELRAIVLSHGHADHHGGLAGIVRRLGQRRMPLLLHPDAWRERRSVSPNGEEVRLPPPDRRVLEQEGVEIVEERAHSLIIDGTALVTGQVERTSGFEPGMPTQQVHTDAGWEPDPWVWDDQGLVLNIAGKGLVVLSGCSHSGVINVLRNARRLTGVEAIYGFAGGLHLTGGTFESIVPPTMTELEDMHPAVIVPGHCSGWRATNEIVRRLPDAYIQSSVGTRLRFD